MNNETLRPIRIFLASPEDCADDREKARAVIQELDRTLAPSLGLSLKSYTWEDVVGGMGRPEQIILDQIQMREIDIFVGLMWQRFGTPTGEDYNSGTEEEFFQAYSTSRSKGQPHILFYFRTDMFYPSTGDRQAQFGRVTDFKNRLKGLGLFTEYKSKEFESKFRQDMTYLLTNWNKLPVVLPESERKVVQGEGWEIWRDAFAPERNGSQRVEAYLYKQANSVVKFMTISGRSVFCNDVEEAIASRNPDLFKFRLLLFDWDSDCFTEKMKDERRQEDMIDNAKEKAKDVAKQFLMIGENMRMDVQVRLYKEYPVWRIMILDETIAYVGYYPPNKRGYEGPMFSFRKTNPLGLFYPINQYFDKLWEVSSPLTLENLK